MVLRRQRWGLVPRRCPAGRLALPWACPQAAVLQSVYVRAFHILQASSQTLSFLDLSIRAMLYFLHRPCSYNCDLLSSWCFCDFIFVHLRKRFYVLGPNAQGRTSLEASGAICVFTACTRWRFANKCERNVCPWVSVSVLTLDLKSHKLSPCSQQSHQQVACPASGEIVKLMERQRLQRKTPKGRKPELKSWLRG